MKAIVHYKDGRTHVTQDYLYPEIAYKYGDLMCEFKDVLYVTYE